MTKLGLSLEELNGQTLELLAREGVRLVLSNGHRDQQVSCGAGEVEVAMPRVSDT